LFRKERGKRKWGFKRKRTQQRQNQRKRVVEDGAQGQNFILPVTEEENKKTPPVVFKIKST
jgi:hypothetical protein